MVDPIATDNSATTAEGNAIVIAVLANDSDADNDPLGITIITPPANGTAEVNGDGTVTYTPGPGFVGTDTFGYEVADGTGGTDTAIATVEVAPVGEATLSITLDGDIQDSNYGFNSFLVTNTGSKAIAKIEIDVTNALFPDTVFDPEGLAGDTISKPLRINSDGDTGVLDPDGNTYVGTGGTAGYEGIQVLFDAARQGGFEPGDTLGFSIDMDPNSIAGAEKGPLDDGATPRWDVGGVSGAELIGSTFTVTFEDGTTATGQLQGVANTQTSNSQGGAIALATQRAHAGTVSLNVDGLVPGGTGTYETGGPQVIVDGPAGETARVVLAKGFLQPGEINFSEPYASQLQAQLDALAATPFPANNAVEIQVRDVALTGSPQDITALFDFTGVPVSNVADPDRLPLGFVASLVDPSGPGLPKGPVSQPIYLTFDTASPQNSPPAAADDAAQSDGSTTTVDVLANDADADADPLSLSSFTQPSSGNVIRNDNGTPGDLTDDRLVYTPDAGFSGQDSFDYTVNDGQGGTATGTVTIDVSDGGGSGGTGFELHINAGGGAFTAADGTQYVADDFFDSGRIADTSDAITATEDDILFQTERFGTFDYLIPVQNGTYAVTFGFAETYLNSVGARFSMSRSRVSWSSKTSTFSPPPAAKTLQ